MPTIASKGRPGLLDSATLRVVTAPDDIIISEAGVNSLSYSTLCSAGSVDSKINN